MKFDTWILKTGDEGMDEIDLAEVVAVVNAEINLQVL
jgi:hypothetical protein